MPKLKSLSGKEVISIFESWGFSVSSQKGSHVKLVRIIESNRQILIVPNHKQIDHGTLAAIIRQASKYIQTDLINNKFRN